DPLLVYVVKNPEDLLVESVAMMRGHNGLLYRVVTHPVESLFKELLTEKLWKEVMSDVTSCWIDGRIVG
ncbi:hypothetical protein HAX54_032539, partial [Datura stramonium]|nr:hypothetical protein [Datura stramonium]